MRDLSDIETVGVVGAGTMGSGIAQVVATSGYEVLVQDVEPEFVDQGITSIAESLDKLVHGEHLSRADADGTPEGG